MAAALFLGALALYGRVASHPFILFDDNRYVTENPVARSGLTWAGVAWAFTTFHASNWHPLTWLSHMLDVELFGVRPGPHHLVNALLHALDSVLVYLALRRLTGAPGRSALAAALFAVHPTHVESVAWVAERKDLLSSCLGLLAIWAYAGYARRGGARRYLAVAGLLALSLLAKPMWVTLPFLLLLLDVWPLQRWAGSPVPVDPEPPPSPRVGARRLVVEKLPLLALSAASAVLTLVAQTRGGAVTGVELGMSARLGNAAVACVRYVGKTFWPWPLAIHYPHPGDALPAWQALAATAAVIGATAAAVALGRRAPWLAVGWLWFLGTLVPVIGLVQVGAQAMADRYTYLPTIGIFLIVSWGATALAARVGRRRAWGVLAAAALVALSATTWRQLDFWSDHVALFRHALEVEPPSGVALGALSEGLRRQGNLDEALLRAQQAVELAPGTARHWNNLGIGYRDLGRLAEARQALLEATRIDPGHATSWINLGLVEMDLGRVPEAMAAYERGLALGAETPSALANLALLYAAVGRIPEADWAFERSARLDPGSAAAWSNLGVFRGREGRWSEALEALERAAQLDPGNGAIRQRLEEARRRAGR